MSKPIRIAFVGVGYFAQCHACALQSLPFYYPESEARAVLHVASSRRRETAERFASQFGFAHFCTTDELWERDDWDAVLLMGPNETHVPHLLRALEKENCRAIYVEKPLCGRAEEAAQVEALISNPDALTGRRVQLGFQMLQMAPMRRALHWVREGNLGRPIHFSTNFLHGDYVDIAYREKKRWRLIPAPAGGATADLGCHVLSLLSAFIGEGRLTVASARASGNFPDVPRESDLCTTALLTDSTSGAAGSMCCSRVSIGSGDILDFALWGDRGAFRFSSAQPDVLSLFEHGEWRQIFCGNGYQPTSRFPSPHVASGWLRALVHAHHLFLGGQDDAAFVPGLSHGLDVQRLVVEVSRSFMQ